jgi:hypothetical protein
MRNNASLDAQPYPVEQALKNLGANLRIARSRRLTINADFFFRTWRQSKRMQSFLDLHRSDGAESKMISARFGISFD